MRSCRMRRISCSSTCAASQHRIFRLNVGLVNNASHFDDLNKSVRDLVPGSHLVRPK